MKCCRAVLNATIATAAHMSSLLLQLLLLLLWLLLLLLLLSWCVLVHTVKHKVAKVQDQSA